MSRNLAARLAVAAVAIPAILWICYQGGWWLLGLTLGLSLLGLMEFLKNEGFTPLGGMFWLSMGALVLNFWTISGVDLGSTCLAESLQLRFGSVGLMLPTVLFFAVTAMVAVVGKEPAGELFQRHSRLVWGTAYLSWLYPFVYLVGQGFSGIQGGDWLLFLFGLLWIGDAAAMWVGMAFGRHKLAPTVSPNKTVEGFLGGILGAVAVAVLMYFWKFTSVSLGQMLMLGVGCSVCGQLGDLVESAWKRSLGVKDSSALIPGHGGVLDRFDSLLFAAPFMYVYLRLAA